MAKSEHIHGIHAVESWLTRSPERVRQLWLQEGREDARLQALAAGAEQAGVKPQRVPRATLDRLVPESRHQGVVAEVLPLPPGDEAGLQDLTEGLGPQALLLVLDGVQDPHNLGACLRSADAAGADAVILPRDKSAGLTPVARKVASGAAEALPVFAVTNLARVLKRLKAAGFWLYGAAGEAEQSLYEQRLEGRIAWVLGAEGKGLRRLTREHCDVLVRIPMGGTVESLNVSVATGVVLFETRRQRLATRAC
ncbi:23S rRNA (guanosine(2251)-2'-O)-methyltransferase RlmB [Thiohalobacter thiocyanaticus]|uniref:23S rRNA (guanosine-2'-O-)-methyltransferase RlmB n=1 Tax=Thiohalobacter thiocyanaticus TaxID=585455 RepID=A0A426QLW9_9GAMM|nr:23S rRNA (guanosine(2251)-2'-O)-methyltransferase RlmB [Thiohalobacter thiocyanaticus]RRQ22666.1 23S rRNA (guanosine(2251)-2'-O)-methyltransferase RlmB [Thiohalobacter thiocyanaticus]